MYSLSFAIFCGLFVAAFSRKLPAPYTEDCIVGKRNLYPPNSTTKIPWFTVSLDDAPDQRWNQIANAYKPEINELIDVVKNLSIAFFHNKLIDYVDRTLGAWDRRLPQPYADELKGIARVTGKPLGEIVLYNVFYEIFTVCTSIIAQDSNGQLYHARNLDFGLFMGWDPVKHDWQLTEKLRKMVVNIEWKKDGKTLYKSTNFAGFIGIYNGIKQDAFSITANERFALDGGFVGIIEWLLGGNKDKWMTFLTREVLENASSFDEAKSLLSNDGLMSPVYFILGGNKPGEGVIITRSRQGAVNTLSLDPTSSDGWFLLQTNYDNWKQPLFIDDRRTPGSNCMKKLGQGNVDFAGLFNVLSSTTNLNKLTVYTALMQVNNGTLESYVQQCPQPCWPF